MKKAHDIFAKMVEEASSLTEAQLKAACMSITSPDHDIVLKALLNALKKKIAANEFIEFCSGLS